MHSSPPSPLMNIVALLLGSRSLFYGGFLYGSGLLIAILAGTACTLWLSIGSLFALLGRGLFVGLLCLTLLKTFGNGLAASTEDNLNAVLSIVVGRDNVVDIVRVRVGIDDTEHRNTKAVSLVYCDVLLHYVDSEECRRQTCKVGNRTQVLLELSTLTGNLQQLAL